MKVNITLSIDENLRKELQEVDNASLLVNSLLKDYFESTGLTKSIDSKEKEEAIIEQVKLKMKKEEEARQRKDREIKEKEEYDKKDREEWKNTSEEMKRKLIEEENIWALNHQIRDEENVETQKI